MKLATAKGVARRLSSVVEGRNGAMTHPSPSSMRPSGAMCSLPSSLNVVTMHSRIMGMRAPPTTLRLLPFFLHGQRMAGLFEARRVFTGLVGGHTPIDRLVLGVALAEAPGDLRLRQLGR